MKLQSLNNLGSAQSLMRGVQSELGTAKGGDPFNDRPNPKGDTAAIKQLANDFEGLFLGIVLKSMRDTVPKDSMIDGGNAEDIYKSMLDSEYTKLMSAQRKTGIADNIEKFLLEASGNMERTNQAMAKLQEAKGLKAYKDLPPVANQETMISKAK
jgi:flagellar protein FlgJ